MTLFDLTSDPSAAMRFDKLGDALDASALVDGAFPDNSDCEVEPTRDGWRVMFNLPLGETVWLAAGPTRH